MTQPRVIITARYLVETFSHLGNDIMILVLAGFTLDDSSQALAYFEDRIAEVDAMPDQPGKQGAIEAWVHLKVAYEGMSYVERKRVASELIQELANHIRANS